MDEYIPRKAVLAKQHIIHVRSDNGEIDYKHRCIDPGDVVAIPAADVAPVRHGLWVPCRIGELTSTYKCSVCERRVCVSGEEQAHEAKLQKEYPYCHCGARMDGGQNEKAD